MKPRIAHVCPFSEGGCGVWMRAKQEAIEFSKKNYPLAIFSTDKIKGEKGFASRRENLNDIKIFRFPAIKLGGESFMYWNFEEEILNFKPDIIMAHNYRHLHTLKSLNVKKKLEKKGHKCNVFLVTHAPFPEGNITRKWFETLSVKLYDFFIGRLTLNKFDKILAISHWEIPELIKRGAKKEKIVYIPNGIPKEFFTQKKSKEQEKILFLGRISPKKKIESLVQAIPYLKNKKVKIEIVGPAEEEYLQKIKKIIKGKKVSDRIVFSPAIYDLKEKIKKLDSAKIYALASRVEGMPQSLIEAMAREKIVIGSDSLAIRDLIQDKKTGFLFEFDNPQDLARVLDKALERKDKKIQKAAKKSVEHYQWKRVIDQIEKVVSD